MKKRYNVTLSKKVVEKIRSDGTINLSGLINRLLLKHLEDKKNG